MSRRKIACAFAVLCLGASAPAATLVVDLHGAGQFADIQAAIDAAADGDTVLVKPGEFVSNQPVRFGAKAITVTSEGGAGVTAIRLTDPAPGLMDRYAVLFDGEAADAPVLAGFRIYGQKGWQIGAVCAIRGAASVTDCMMTEGGGAEGVIGVQHAAALRLARCTVAGNSRGNQNAAVATAGAVSLDDCTIAGNAGHGVRCGGGRAALRNCTIAGNAGCGVYSYGTELDLANCIVWENGMGSISIAGDDPPPPKVAYSCIEGNAAWPGAGNLNEHPLFCGYASSAPVFVDPANPQAGDGTEANPFSSLGPALAYSLALAPESPCLGAGEGGTDMGAPTGRCEASGALQRTVHLAAGIYGMQGFNVCHQISLEGAGAAETIVNGTIAGLCGGARVSALTVRWGDAGGIIVSPGHRGEISSVTIASNGAYSTFTGGGICCLEDSAPVITGCTISDNCGVWWGGGIYCAPRSAPVVTDCRITGNFTDVEPARWGGGIFVGPEAAPLITNCIISGNWAESGGGVFAYTDSRPVLRNCTIADNCRARGSIAVGAIDSFLTMVNCIVWEDDANSMAEWPSGESRLAVAHSCIASAEPWPGNDNINVDPLFVSRGRWDTQADPDRWIDGDYRLTSGSPCIDSGTAASAPSLDIAGFTRPCGAGVDMGAHEFGRCGAPDAAFRRGDPNADGKIDLADPIHTLAYLFASGAGSACLDGADANDDGSLDIADALAILNHLFAKTGPLPPPFDACGSDPTGDELGCRVFAPCER